MTYILKFNIMTTFLKHMHGAYYTAVTVARAVQTPRQVHKLNARDMYFFFVHVVRRCTTQLKCNSMSHIIQARPSVFGSTKEGIQVGYGHSDDSR